MARQTRYQTRLKSAVSSATGTPTTFGSPAFSVEASPQSEETSPPSDVDDKPEKNSTSAGKRKLKDVDSDALDSENSDSQPRKKVASRAFVALPAVKQGRAERTQSARPVASRRYSLPVFTPVISDDEIIPDSEEKLEYDERNEESDFSGPEFNPSEEEPDAVAPDSEEDVPLQIALQVSREDVDSEAEDEEMMDAAVRESILSCEANSAGPSAGRKSSLNPKTAARAAAAEKRFSKKSKLPKLEESDASFSEGQLSESDDMADSDDEPKDKAKAKGKSKSKGKMKDDEISQPLPLSFADIKKNKKEARQRAALNRTKNKAEEKALVKKLGRNLTHGERTSVALQKHHPELRDVWGDLESSIPIPVPQKAEQPANLKLKLLPFQLESLFWMRKQEKTIWSGGMLADEMGMGKTVQIIALLVTDGAKPNLVVAPTVAIMQWRNEIATHTDGVKVLVWHGQSRETDIQKLKSYDVILTSYAVLESCFRKQQTGTRRKGNLVKEKSPMHGIIWNRIILDEAHNIKERSTNTAKAAFELKGKYRWCLSGTPLQNRVGELYSLVRFLDGDPFSYYFCKDCDCKSLHWKFTDRRTCDACGHSPMHHTCFWNTEILTPIQKNGMSGPGRVALKKLKILLDRMMLRRTKVERADDLGLPPRTVIVRRDYFSPEEKELYLSLFSDAKRQFSTYLDSGTILNNYSNVFSLITRMRQMACHPDLVLRSARNASTFVGDEAGEATVCRICSDVAEDAIQSKCRHIFDRECIKQYLNTAVERNPACPVCHLPLTIDLQAEALELENNLPNARQGILGRLNLDTWKSSTKIEALIEELTNLRLKDATTKSLVFSQFVNFLDLIAYRLQKAGFNICRLEGNMSPQARNATIQHFSELAVKLTSARLLKYRLVNNVDVTIFLVSLKAGGVALNLTEASRVYLMDSWWNPAVEYQAMDRIHRLGQHRPVQAIKLVVEDSIESRIVQLQEKKSAMVEGTLSTDETAMGRLTPGDLGFLFRL